MRTERDREVNAGPMKSLLRCIFELSQCPRGDDHVEVGLSHLIRGLKVPPESRRQTCFDARQEKVQRKHGKKSSMMHERRVSYQRIHFMLHLNAAGEKTEGRRPQSVIKHVCDILQGDTTSGFKEKQCTCDNAAHLVGGK